MADASFDELKLLLRLEQPSDDQFAELCLSAAKVGVAKFCRRSFGAPSGSAVSRVFVPGRDVVWIDDLASTSGVVVSNYGSTVTADDMQFEPLNQLTDAMTYTPYTAIRLKSSWWHQRGQEATVTVTSDQWGWTGGAPDMVRRTQLELAKDLFQFKDMRGGVAGFGEFGAIRLRENPAIAMMLDPLYVRYDRMGIA
jgi:hypothetical protein